MSEHHDRKTCDFVKYDAMETEELEELLRLDSQTPEGSETDTERLLYIMGVLADRKRNSVDPGKTAQESWKSFEESYLSDEAASLDDIQKTPAKGDSHWLRRVIGTAAVIAILLCVPLTVKAFGWKDLWNAVATWAKETFSFVIGNQEDYSDPVPRDISQYESFQEALNCGLENPMQVPTWIPDKYSLNDITIKEIPDKKIFTAYYSSVDGELVIQVKSYLQSDPNKIETVDNVTETYHYAGTDYYIYENLEDTCAAWMKDSFECYISGQITVEEMKAMIDSIGKG